MCLRRIYPFANGLESVHSPLAIRIVVSLWAPSPSTIFEMFDSASATMHVLRQRSNRQATYVWLPIVSTLDSSFSSVISLVLSVCEFRHQPMSSQGCCQLRPANCPIPLEVNDQLLEDAAETVLPPQWCCGRRPSARVRQCLLLRIRQLPPGKRHHVHRCQSRFRPACFSP